MPKIQNTTRCLQKQIELTRSELEERIGFKKFSITDGCTGRPELETFNLEEAKELDEFLINLERALERSEGKSNDLTLIMNAIAFSQYHDFLLIPVERRLSSSENESAEGKTFPLTAVSVGTSEDASLPGTADVSLPETAGGGRGMSLSLESIHEYVRPVIQCLIDSYNRLNEVLILLDPPRAPSVRGGRERNLFFGSGGRNSLAADSRAGSSVTEASSRAAQYLDVPSSNIKEEGRPAYSEEGRPARSEERQEEPAQGKSCFCCFRRNRK